MMRHSDTMLPILFCFLFVLALDASADTFYKWVDEKGVTHMTNQPPDGMNGSQKPGEEGAPSDAALLPSRSTKFVAKSNDWLKPGIKNLYTTVEITPVRDRTYRVKIRCEREVRPFSAVEPDDVLFFSFCVASRFAALKGFNRWAMQEDETKKDERIIGKRDIEYSIALVKAGPRANAPMRETCSKFIRPEFLWDEVPFSRVLDDRPRKPACRRLMEVMLNQEFIRHVHQKKDVPGERNVFRYSLDVDGDGKTDRVTERITGKTTHLDVQCASGHAYKLVEDGSLFLLTIDRKEYAMISDVAWDEKKRQGKTTGMRLFELTRHKADLVCDRSDLQELIR
jgi:hypothetical protein